MVPVTSEGDLYHFILENGSSSSIWVLYLEVLNSSRTLPARIEKIGAVNSSAFLQFSVVTFFYSLRSFTIQRGTFHFGLTFVMVNPFRLTVILLHIAVMAMLMFTLSAYCVANPRNNINVMT